MTFQAKICGLSTAHDVQVAVEHGADMLGFVLTDSAREVTVQQAADLIAQVPDSVQTVAVFRNEPLSKIIELASAAKVEWIQLHGTRTAQDVAAGHAAGFKVIRAVKSTAEDSEFQDLGEDLLLIDAPVPGSGEAWDYAAVKQKVAGREWLVAGGLTPQNVAQALSQSLAAGADVSSGVEASRGVKDPEKIIQFLDAVKHS